MNRRYLMILGVAVAALAMTGVAGAAVLNYEATIDASQEVPANPSGATGSATVTIDTDANTLTYSISYGGLAGTETAAHIHGFAGPGINAGVLHPLPAGNPKNGVWNYSEAQEADILAGLTYINIHTTLYAGGEIRGQIVESQGVPTEPTTWGQIKRLFP